MKPQTKRRVIIGLSGGVDSAVAAYRLQQQGYDILAVFMKNFSERVGGAECPWKQDRLEAYRVAAFLNIPIQTWDFEQHYKKLVLDYMYTEYKAGRTPNPDIMCNKEIKFKVFLERAMKQGFDTIATGHYAKLRRGKNGMCHLHKAKDTNKDQSYFLAMLSQQQLQHVLFPLADMTKPQVRALAKKIKLPNADRRDSQGICFVGNVDMTTFLMNRIKPKLGKIVDTNGRVLGQHRGVYYYTIGQRKGIEVGGGPALYVVDKDVTRNTLVVGTQDQLDLFKKDITVSGWHWLAGERSLPLSCKAKIRYRQVDQIVTLTRVSGKKIRARFARPQRAVAPGQILAAYKGSELIGSGIIQ